MPVRTPYSIRRTNRADQDLKDIRDYTVETFGRDAARAYTALLRQAFKDIQADPFTPGSKERPDIAPHIRSFHISLSKSRAQSTIKSPRHLILYFLPKENEIIVSRVLHDSRDLARHLPEHDADRVRAFKQQRGQQAIRDRDKDRSR